MIMCTETAYLYRLALNTPINLHAQTGQAVGQSSRSHTVRRHAAGFATCSEDPERMLPAVSST